ncbi:MAG: retroviral-like aspartic protease family protein [Hormoscilla sp. GUM202]|nr:retroviral-like aspartic protease family protein [Hormoscilla sp. GUM202]
MSVQHQQWMAVPHALCAVAPSVQPPSTKAQPDYYQRARLKADSAVSIGQSAQSPDDWQLVASRWQQAIALLQAIPPDSPQRTHALTKIAEYQGHLAQAQEQAQSNHPAASAPVVLELASAASQTSPRVFPARIKRRIGGTPVIDVRFNGSQTFEMIVDTGASGVAITEDMARSLDVVTVGVITANTASDKEVEFSIGNVLEIAVGGAVVRDVQVAIAPQLDIGLLGHDFFGNYDIIIRRDVI